MADRQRAGLVERQHGHTVHALEGFCILDQDAMAGRNAGANHDGGRRCQAQGTGAGDHQHGDGVNQGLRPVAVINAPADQGQHGDGDNRRHKNGGDTVDQALHRRLARLRVLHGFDDTRQCRLGADRPDPGDQHPFPIERAADQRRTWRLRYRQILSSDHRLVDMAVALKQFGVHRNAFARPDRDLVADPQQIDGDFLLDAIGAQPCAFRAQRLQGPDRFRGLAARPRLKPLAKAHQHDDHGPRLEIQGVVVARVQQLENAQPIGGAGAQGHQHIHIAAAGAHRAPRRPVEPGADPELDRRRQQPLHNAWQHQLESQRSEQHRQHQGQGQHGGDGDQPRFRQARHHFSARLAARRGLIAGALHCCHQYSGIDAGIIGGDARLLGGQVDGSTLHPRYILQRLLDPQRAGRATHAADGKGKFSLHCQLLVLV